MKQGQSIKWVSKDDQGRFEHVGIILNTSPTHITINTQFGEIIIPSDDGTITPYDGIVNLKPQPITQSTTTTKSTKKQRSGTKKEKALSLYKNMTSGDGTHPTRKLFIQTLISSLNMTPAGASTYAAMCKKHFSN